MTRVVIVTEAWLIDSDLFKVLDRSKGPRVRIRNLHLRMMENVKAIQVDWDKGALQNQSGTSIQLQSMQDPP